MSLVEYKRVYCNDILKYFQKDFLVLVYYLATHIIIPHLKIVSRDWLT